jgi:hypothetical protein
MNFSTPWEHDAYKRRRRITRYGILLGAFLLAGFAVVAVLRERETGVSQEVYLGQPVNLGGRTAVATNLSASSAISVIEDGQYATVHVSLSNSGDDGMEYGPQQFAVQTASGRLITANLVSTLDGYLGVGALVPGGHVEGDLIFDVGAEDYAQVVIYVPERGGPTGSWFIPASD